MASCPRPHPLAPRWCVLTERLEVLFEELAELTGQRNAIDGRIVEIVAEMDRDELWGATGRAVGGGVGGLEDRLVIGKRPHDRHRRAPAGGVPRCARACGRADCRWIRSASSRGGRPTGPMSITRSWRACATVSQLRTAVKLEPRPEPDPTRPAARTAGLDHQDHRRGVHLLADHTCRTSTRRSSTRRCSLIAMR